ncbi:MAG: BTAD domain-containing putative transcriptional regulator [Trueperaceae bacterium]
MTGTVFIRVFGELRVEVNGVLAPPLESRKAEELLCYLVLNDDGPMRREQLMSVLWPEETTAKAQKHLRQALWRLQRAFGLAEEGARLLRLDGPRLELSREVSLSTDVGMVLDSFEATLGVHGEDLTETQAQSLESAARLYEGGLLAGCYSDWCLLERERLENTTLIILDKLMAYCEATHRHEAGLVHGMRLLELDNAREATHRRIMRIYAELGDRTGAMRQYRRCTNALLTELGVEPSEETRNLFAAIRGEDRHDEDWGRIRPGDALERTRTFLESLRQKVDEGIEAIFRDLDDVKTAEPASRPRK